MKLTRSPCKILIGNLEFEKNEFESQKGCECRSALIYSLSCQFIEKCTSKCISMPTCAMSGHANIFNNVVEYVPLRKSLDRSFYSWFQKFPIHNLKKISRISEFSSGISLNYLLCILIIMHFKLSSNLHVDPPIF